MLSVLAIMSPHTTVVHEARMPSLKSNSNHQFNGKNVFVEFAMAQGKIKLNNDCLNNKKHNKIKSNQLRGTDENAESQIAEFVDLIIITDDNNSYLQENSGKDRHDMR